MASTYQISLEATGRNKIQIIKVLVEHLGLGLKEAKDLCDAAPQVIAKHLAQAKAEALAQALTDIGAEVSITAH